MAITKVIKDLTELNPGDPDYVLNSTNAVTVSSASGSNKYYFNGVYDGKFGLRKGTTVLTGVPSGHPIAVLNDGLTGITYTGTVNEGTQNVPDPGGPLYTFYSGDVTITVTADFGVASYYCKIHGYMGGENNLVSVYSTAGLKMPTGSSAYAAPPTVAPGMIRNLVGIASEGSVSVMQHYNGTEWKNFTNKVASSFVDFLVVAGGGAGGGDNGGAGGAGGLRTSWPGGSGGGSSSENAITLTLGTIYDVAVGDGAPSVSSSAAGVAGSVSTFDSITSAGGGGGGTSQYAATDGGSGGGATRTLTGGVASPAGQGFKGGNGYGSATDEEPTGGGGGAGAAALNVTTNCNTCATAGGVGKIVNILNATNASAQSVGQVSGSSVYYAGGGGGGVQDFGKSGGNGAAGGLGGGGTGGYGCTNNPANIQPLAGTANTGGGGGGTGGCGGFFSGAGGSGVVILRYPTASVASFVVTGSLNTPTAIIEGTDSVLVFKSGTGTVTFS